MSQASLLGSWLGGAPRPVPEYPDLSAAEAASVETRYLRAQLVWMGREATPA